MTALINGKASIPVNAAAPISLLIAVANWHNARRGDKKDGERHIAIRDKIDNIIEQRLSLDS